MSETKLKKEIILIVPSSSHPVVRLVLRFFLEKSAPFGLFVLSALIPSKYRVKIFNQKIFWLKRDFIGGALVGISCSTSNAAQAYKLADRFRQAGSTVIMGGVHASYFPQEALLHCDSVVIGEAESVWNQVLEDYDHKCLQKIYQGTPLEDYFSPVYARFLELDPKILYRTGILLSRGCKYHCDFCARPFGQLRFVKLEQALKLIARMRSGAVCLFGRLPTVIFRDDNLFSSPDYAKKLFKGLISLKVSWTGNSSIDIAFDEEALALAKASGCQGLFIGFETIYPQKLQKTSAGNIRSTGDYLLAIKKIRSYGIKIIGAFIIGFDYYRHRDYLKLIYFLIKSKLYFISLTILTPFPGSALYEQLSQENRITTLDWRKYDSLQHVVFKPKNMPAWMLQFWFVIIRIIASFASPFYIQLLLKTLIAYYAGFYLFSYLTRNFL